LVISNKYTSVITYYNTLQYAVLHYETYQLYIYIIFCLHDDTAFHLIFITFH